jgi:hypothetical protein
VPIALRAIGHWFGLVQGLGLGVSVRVRGKVYPARVPNAARNFARN